MKRETGGFTLVELVIVIGIIAILTTLIIAKISGSRKNGNYLKRLSDINQINLSLQRYSTVNLGKYPTTSGAWYSTHTCSAVSATASTTNYVPGLRPTYIASLPKDPDGATDCAAGPVYMYKSNGRDYKLIVYGDVKDKDIILQKNKSMIDPMRPASTTTMSFGVWTSGGASY